MEKLVVSKSVMENEAVNAYLSEYVDKRVSMDKAGRLLAKSYSKDRKLNNFITASKAVDKWGKPAPFSKGYRFFADETFAEKVIGEVMAGEIGITSLAEKQSLALHIAKKGIDEAVGEKHADLVRGLALSGEQKQTLADALVKYRAFIETQLLPSVLKSLSGELAAIEAEVKEKVAA